MGVAPHRFEFGDGETLYFGGNIQNGIDRPLNFVDRFVDIAHTLPELHHDGGGLFKDRGRDAVNLVKLNQRIFDAAHHAFF